MLRIGFAVALVAVCTALVFIDSAEARSRGRGSTPYVTTPMGRIPKSVYYAPYLDEAQIMRFRAAEEAYMKKYAPKSGANGTTAKKPTTTKKKT
jgi:hypothetical protein